MSVLPVISVLMPNFNGAKHLSEAIESILAQTFRDFEFIIVDDCSSDESWDIIRNIAGKDDRILPLRNERNLGICGALNRGLTFTRGDYVVRMDSDDVARPDRLFRQAAFMGAPGHRGIGVCGSSCQVIDDAGLPLGIKTFPLGDREIKRSFFRRNPIQHSASIIRRACFDELGPYDERLLLAEDLDLWMRFGQRYELANLPEVLMDYRISDRSSIIAHQKAMLKQTIRARREGAHRYGYRMSGPAWLSLAATWMMQFLPSRIVSWLFMRAIHVKS
jgi:glycosyltransferase involved in cell wall biosynthesis